MKAAHTNLIKRMMGCTLAIASFMAPLAAVEGAALTISGITHEQVGYRPGCSSQFGGTTTGTGTSSLLGAVSIEGNDCITPIENYLSFEGKMVFTVSNGDELFADYSGLFVPTFYPLIFSLSDSIFNITGGTGSFAKATGGGILQGGQNIATGTGLMQAKGSIFDFKKPKNKNKDKDKDEDKNEGKGKNAAGLQMLSLRAAEEQDGSAFVVDGPIDLAALANFNNSLSANVPVLGDHYYESQDGQLFFINALPESGTLSLLGIGLVSIAVMRRRERSNLATDR